MEIIATTPFGQRPVSVTLIKHHKMAYENTKVPQYDKWELFRELCVARCSFGVTNRDLTVLNALLSFHQNKILSDNENMTVFPSNAALSERAYGMAESTLRRHLAALVKAGLILRHDSPNGKRYAAKDASGAIVRAFGFNLRPMLVQAVKIAEAASEARLAVETRRRKREEVSVLLRDASKLAEYGMEEKPSRAWQGLQERCRDAYRIIRRKLSLEAITELLNEVRSVMSNIQGLLGMHDTNKTSNMSGKDSSNERHYQNSNTDTNDFEPCLEKQKGGEDIDEAETLDEIREETENKANEPKLPIGLVLKTCPDILAYAKDEVRSWYDLIATAHFVRGMMGISLDAWKKAQVAMGPENAAVVLACILQRVGEIHSPGGYLRTLTKKAENGAFSPGPMVMALLRGANDKVA